MKYLVDSDFLFGLFVLRDPHHKKSVSLLNKLTGNDELIVLNLVVQETATVLSNKDKQTTAILFLTELIKMPVSILFIGEEDEKLGWEVFKKQTKKRTSFIDSMNLAIAQKYKFDKILSFDEFYPKSIRMTS
jgi:predicted nucleic acid-binding protein